MNANQADAKGALSVRAMCRVLGVSHSGYYDWRDRPPSARAVANAILTERIRQVHRDSDETYGMRRVRAQLRHEGQRASRKRVARLMREACLRGVSRRRGFTVTTERNVRARPAPDLVNRQFVADAPNVLWVADMTYIPTWTGFLYLAVVLDAFSRKVVGWAMGEQMTAELVIAALNMALHTRRPASVIHHSDQGSQGGFNRSSQRWSVGQILGSHPGPRQASSSPTSFVVSCSTCARPPRFLRHPNATGQCPSGSTAAAARWCSHWCRAAKGCAGRRRRPARQTPR